MWELSPLGKAFFKINNHRHPSILLLKTMNWGKSILILLCFAFLSASAQQRNTGSNDSLYHERYRNQYHFSQRHGWISDPCGFLYYDGNPVLDIGYEDFRDPTVIWHEESQQWIMVVSKTLESKAAFYGSKDLKNWTWLSDFGPAGRTYRCFECPDFFSLTPSTSYTMKVWPMKSIW